MKYMGQDNLSFTNYLEYQIYGLIKGSHIITNLFDLNQLYIEEKKIYKSSENRYDIILNNDAMVVLLEINWKYNW